MKTRKNTYLAIVAALMVLFTLTGCNKDGNETITLERGSAAKMLPGRWIIGITKGTPPLSGWMPGTIVIFYPGGGDRGTFKSYPEGASGQWYLPDGGDTPRINIGGKDFEIESGGTTIWRCKYPYGNQTPSWEGTLEKESDDTGDPAVVPDNQTDTDPRAVDLGLSVLWASMNVGAKSEADPGTFYAWGETKTKSSYSETNSDWYGKTLAQLSALPGSGFMKDIGGSRYDVATVSWEGKWRMPTEHEFYELIGSCTIKRESRGNVNGLSFTSKYNGNSIFMPMAGLKVDNKVIGNNRNFYYWGSESSYIGNILTYAQSMVANPDVLTPKVEGTNVYYGLTVRPVKDK